MNQPEAPFYLAVKHQREVTDAVWYKKNPLGKNEIRKLLTKAAGPKCWFARTSYQSLALFERPAFHDCWIQMFLKIMWTNEI